MQTYSITSKHKNSFIDSFEKITLFENLLMSHLAKSVTFLVHIETPHII